MANEDALKDSISCMDCVNAFFHCISPKNQFSEFWRQGEFNMCKTPMKEFAFCMKLKFADKEEAREMLKELLREEPSPTIGHIWEAREQPPSGAVQSTR